jgi:hypothetical protein
VYLVGNELTKTWEDKLLALPLEPACIEEEVSAEELGVLGDVECQLE